MMPVDRCKGRIARVVGKRRHQRYRNPRRLHIQVRNTSCPKTGPATHILAGLTPLLARQSGTQKMYMKARTWTRKSPALALPLHRSGKEAAHSASRKAKAAKEVTAEEVTVETALGWGPCGFPPTPATTQSHAHHCKLAGCSLGHRQCVDMISCAPLSKARRLFQAGANL